MPYGIRHSSEAGNTLVLGIVLGYVIPTASQEASELRGITGAASRRRDGRRTGWTSAREVLVQQASGGSDRHWGKCTTGTGIQIKDNGTRQYALQSVPIWLANGCIGSLPPYHIDCGCGSETAPPRTSAMCRQYTPQRYHTRATGRNA